MEYHDKLLEQYLTTALWSSTCDTGDFAGDQSFLDENYDLDDISQSLKDSSKADLIAFLESTNELLEDNDFNREYVGHDFWLTRNGHGTGFWDRDYKHGDKLTELSKPFGTVDLYVGADGLVYGA